MARGERRWTLCRDCGRALAEGEPSVYRHEPRMVLCDVCAVLRGIRPTASRTYSPGGLHEPRGVRRARAGRGLPAGMVLVCNRCRERWGEGDPDLPTSWEGTPQARCPRCDEDESWVLKGFYFESIHRPQKATARRWGSALRGEDTSHGTFPDVLLLACPRSG